MIKLTLLIIAICNLSNADLVLPPIKGSQQQYALIWFQGASCSAQGYQQLMRAIQDSFDQALWIAVPSFPLDTPQPLSVQSVSQSAIKALLSQGMPANTLVFYGGHSLGGVIAQDYLNNNTKVSSIGLILHGSYIQRKYVELQSDGHHKTTLNIATIQIGAELDGLTRVTRLAESFYVHQLNAHSSTKPSNYPVIIIKGASHNQFYSEYNIPTFVKNNDLKPEISYTDARSAIAQATAAFMKQQLGLLNYSLDSYTKTLLQPIVDALLLEGYYFFKPPCYATDLVNPNIPTCGHGAEWGKIAQISLAALQGTKTQVLVDPNFHEVQTPPVKLPQINNQCDGTTICQIKTVIVVEALYEKMAPMDTANTYISASEIKTKMVSRQVAWQKGGKKDQATNFDQTDGGDLCAEANQLAIDWAMSHLPKETISRYSSSGVHMRVGPDMGPYNAGPLWIWTYMSYINEKDENGKDVVTVRSPMMKTSADFYMQEIAGVHYCKILSPARVAEWIYLESLRKNNHL